VNQMRLPVSLRPVVLQAALVGVLFADGLLAARSPKLGVAVALLELVAIWIGIRGPLAWWDGLLCLIGGSLVLTYGFANIGIVSSAPLPLADGIVLLLTVRALTAIRPASAKPLFFCAAVYFCWASVRLSIDYPVWHANALRDYTTAAEMGCVLVGYWAMKRYGLQRFLALRWVMLAAVVYLLFYPVRSALETLGPTVGLQQPVPLLGTYDGAGIGAVVAALYFLTMRPFGRLSYLFGGLGLADLVVLQQRGLYVAAFAALLVLIAVAPRWSRVRGKLIGGLVAAGLAVVILFAVGPSGRLGRATPHIVLSQLETLAGYQGAGAGTLKTRESFLHDTLSKLRQRPYRWVVGAGLGPDLTEGFNTGSTVGVRKPHDDYLEAFGRLGVIGLLALLGVVGLGWLRIVKAARRGSGEVGRFLLWIAAATLVYLVVAATQPLLAYVYGTVPLFTLLGAGWALGEQSFPREARPAGATNLRVARSTPR
jgi:O-antigen ligase